MEIQFSIIVAVDKNFGMGKAGGLPWHLPGELKHFKEITTASAENSAKQNAVIMGRKTWDSLPEKFKPLPGRLNIVLTRNKNISLPNGVGRAVGLDEALSLIEKNKSKVGQVFVIGGAEVFAAALKHPHCQNIYLTQIDQVFDCDVFFPKNFSAFFKKIEESSLHKEQGFSYQFLKFSRG